MSAQPALRPFRPALLPCPDCDGQGRIGFVINDTVEKCCHCKGTGHILCIACGEPAVSNSPGEWSCAHHLTHCPDCDGPVTDGINCPTCEAASAFIAGHRKAS